MNMNFYEWLRECCKILGCDFDLICPLVRRDLNGMYSEGLSPKQAVAKWESHS